MKSNHPLLPRLRRLTLNAAVLLAIPACTVVPSGVVAPGQSGNIVQLGGRMKLQTASANLEIDNVESFKDGSKLVDNGIKAWGIVKTLDRWLDSEDAADASAKALEGKKLDSANEASKIANDHELALKTLEMEEAELVTDVVPTPAP